MSEPSHPEFPRDVKTRSRCKILLVSWSENIYNVLGAKYLTRSSELSAETRQKMMSRGAVLSCLTLSAILNNETNGGGKRRGFQSIRDSTIDIQRSEKLKLRIAEK